MRIRALREALGAPTLPRLRRLVARLSLAQDASDRLSNADLDVVLSQYSGRVRSNELLAILMGLKLLRNDRMIGFFTLDHHAVSCLEGALEFYDDEEEPESNTWLPVATLPGGLPQPLSMRPTLQTASAIFSLMEEARSNLWLVTPFLDSTSVDFLRKPIVSAINRGVSVRILTTERNASFIEALLKPIGAPFTPVHVWFADAGESDLGSHAKAVVADSRAAYIGSANLTSYGLMKHFEVGALLKGPGVSTLTALFETLASAGRLR